MGSNGRTTRPSQDIKEKGNQGNYQTETVITSLSRPLSFAHKSTFTLTLCSKPWVYACVSVCVRMWTRVCVCNYKQEPFLMCMHVCFYMCAWVRAMNVPCIRAWERPDTVCQPLLCLSSSLVPRTLLHSRSQWWMMANGKFPLLDCWLPSED